jgi:uncharacterized protein (DUF2236 family)
METTLHDDLASLVPPSGVSSFLVSPSFVSRPDSETLIRAIERTTLERTGGDRRVGIFGPASMSWKINREAALFLGAGRAALLQLAHPWVATALDQHSSLMSRPIARFHSTFRIVFAMVFGSLDQALAAARHLYTRHTRVRGEMPQDIASYSRGSLYEANEVAALLWVYATLVESAVLAYECAMPPLTADELTEYYAESRTLAAFFGLPPAALPESWTTFLTYCRHMEQSNALGVSDTARKMAHNLMAGAGSWIKPPRWYRALTTKWLPQRLRMEFGLHFGEAEEHAAMRAQRLLPRFYRRLPDAMRFVGPWHEAQARLAGRQVSSLARLSNRFWIGQPYLPFAVAD